MHKNEKLQIHCKKILRKACNGNMYKKSMLALIIENRTITKVACPYGQMGCRERRTYMPFQKNR